MNLPQELQVREYLAQPETLTKTLWLELLEKLFDLNEAELFEQLYFLPVIFSLNFSLNGKAKLNTIFTDKILQSDKEKIKSYRVIFCKSQ